MFERKQSMNIFTLAISLTILLSSFFQMGLSHASDRLSIQVKLWQYTSLCDFQDSSNWPTKAIYKKGTSFSSSGCKDLETQYGHPPAVLVELKNTGNSEIEIPLRGMKSITLVTKVKTITPLAIRNRQPSPFGSGYMKSFDTKFTGEKVIVLQQSQIVDLIFIFSEAEVEDTLTIRDVGTAKISKSHRSYEKKLTEKNSTIENSKSNSPLPSFTRPLNGNNEVRVKNPNDFKVKVGLRSGPSGKDFEVAANGIASVFVPNGPYAIYFVYSNNPDALFQGDNFKLNDNGIEIQIVKVSGGNYGIRRVK